MGLLVLLALLYAYLASDTVHKVAALERGKETTEKMLLELSEIESERISFERGLSAETASRLGLSEEHNPLFVVPPTDSLSVRASGE